MRARLLRTLFAFLVSLGWGACDRTETPPASPTPTIQQQRAERAAEVPKPIQERWDYLNRLRQSDAFDAIDRTLVDEQDELGVVLAANLTPEKTAATMKEALDALARKFPDADMVLNAYVATMPLRKVGTARYGAQTGQITYTPAP